MWYITKYARLSNGKVDIISYTKAPNFEVACGVERINLPNNQFYRAENRVGSLLPPLKYYWVARETYSHKPKLAQMQVEAELEAQHIIDAQDIEFTQLIKTMKELKSLLTKSQYDVVFQFAMRKPSAMKYLYEKE